MSERWTSVELGSLVEEVSGERVSDPHMYPLLTVGLYGKGVRPSGKFPNITKKGRPYYVRPPGTILIGRQNLHNASVGIVPLLDAPHVTSNAISCFTSNEETTNEYLALALSSRVVTDLASSNMGGTGQKEIPVSKLLRLHIPLPPKHLQDKIVETMGTIDCLIAALEFEIEATAQLLATVQSDLPSSQQVRLGDVLDSINSGKSIRALPGAATEGDPQILKLSAVGRGIFQARETKLLSSGHNLPERFRVNRGDVLITRSNTPTRVGYVARVDCDVKDVYMPDLIWRLVPSDRIDPDFLVHALSSPQARERIARLASGTSSSMVKLNMRRLRDLEIPLPGRSEQAEFAKKCSLVRDLLESLQAELICATSLRTEVFDRSFDKCGVTFKECNEFEGAA